MVYSTPASNPTAQISGPGRSLARAVGLAALVLTLVVILAAIPTRYQQLLETYQNLSPAQELILREWGASGVAHARVVFGVELLVMTLFFAIALLIFWRRSRDWVAMLGAVGLVTYISWTSPTLDSILATDTPLRFPAMIVQVLGHTLAGILFFVFPDGRFVPRWTRFLIPFLVVWDVAWLLLPTSVFDLTNPFQLPLASFLLMMSWRALCVGCQVYRYFRVATPIQRQQMKWILFGVSVAIATYVVFGFDRFALPLLRGPAVANVVYDLIGVPIFLLAAVMIPASFAFSIFRYRLWEIDFIINRAVVYGILTAFIAGAATTSVILSRVLFISLTGERSDVAIVLTTLIVASLIAPVRTSLQTIVDRYLKHTPDPMAQLKALGDQVRSFVDLVDVDRLTRKAVDDAVRAFGATSGAVYLRDNDHFQVRHVVGDWAQIEGMSSRLESRGMRLGWIVLGPRSNGQEYSENDQAAFDEVAALVADAIHVIHGDLKHTGHGATQPISLT